MDKILKEENRYYENLYSKHTHFDTDTYSNAMESFVTSAYIPKLSDESKKLCESHITETDITLTGKGSKTGMSPLHFPLCFSHRASCNKH